MSRATPWVVAGPIVLVRLILIIGLIAGVEVGAIVVFGGGLLGGGLLVGFGGGLLVGLRSGLNVDRHRDATRPLTPRW